MAERLKRVVMYSMALGPRCFKWKMLSLSGPKALLFLQLLIAFITRSEGEPIKCMKTILDDKSLNSEATTNLQEPLHSQLPNKPPRKTKTKPVSVLNSNAKQMNTIDNYVTRDSPSTKRKLSDESTSPSSVQIAKTSRTHYFTPLYTTIALYLLY